MLFVTFPLIVAAAPKVIVAPPERPAVDKAVLTKTFPLTVVGLPESVIVPIPLNITSSPVNPEVPTVANAPDVVTLAKPLTVKVPVIDVG